MSRLAMLVFIGFRPSTGAKAVAALLVAAAAFLAVESGPGTLAAVDHTSGFTRYARVDRTDGTYREMLIDNGALAALRGGAEVPAGSTILMETYYQPGQLSTIFAERYDGNRWLYASFMAGENLPRFRMDASCSSCHRAARQTDTLFTKPMILNFAETRKIQRTTCDQSGRAPCPAGIYAARTIE